MQSDVKERLHNNVINNAILRFDMRMQMRKKASLVQMAIITGVSAVIIALTILISNLNMVSADTYSSTGRVLFYVIASLHFVFVVFMTPAVSGISISSERESQTLEVLLCSQMSPLKIVLGKYLSSVSWIILLSFMILPSYMMLILMGGVNVLAVLTVFVYIIFIMMVIAAIAVYFSALLKRSAPAIIITYAVIFGIVTVLIMLSSLFNAIVLSLQTLPSGGVYIRHIFPPTSYFNPVYTYVMILVSNTEGLSTVSNLFECNEINIILSIIITLIVYSALSVLMIFGAIRHVNPLREKNIKVEGSKKGKKHDRQAI